MPSQLERLRLALAAIDRFGAGKRAAADLRRGVEQVERHWADLDDATRRRIDADVEELAQRDVDVCFIGDDSYPRTLAATATAPAMLFTWGNTALFDVPSVGMCGSRNVSEKGLEAARNCGLQVARHGLAIVSGYAKGVDTETHLAALTSGGRTIIVLAEGILHFRRKRVFSEVPFDAEHVLVVSQFPPRQRWNVGAAMTRNGVITGLGRALVVIEAGETGGTLNAGLQALDMGRPVLALEFSEGTPPGNEALFKRGATRIDRPSRLTAVLDDLGEPAAPAEQLSIL